MRARFTRRALVLALLGAFLCALVWSATKEPGPRRAANIGKLSAILEPSNGSNSRSAQVCLTNRGAGDLRVLGILLQSKDPDGVWREHSNAGVDVTLRPGASRVVVVNGIKEGDYRPLVSYSSELTGLRRLTKRFTRAVKKRKLSLLWDSGTSYRYGEAVGEERHFD